MNERVQELSEQAEKYADDNFRGEPTWSEAFESKFAELIVEECIKVVQQQDRTPPGFLYAKGAHTHEFALRTHFGMNHENS